MKQTIILVLVIGTAFGVGYGVGAKTSAPKPQVRSSLVDSIDFAEYEKLKSAKEKYEKADEILSQMLLIFLTDLGIQNAEGKVAEAKRHWGLEPTPPIPQPDLGRPVSAVAVNPTPYATPPMAKPAVEVVPPKKSATTQILALAERALEQVSNEDEAQNFLESATIPELLPYIQSATDLRRDQAQTLNGSFVGRIVFLPEDGKPREPWDVELNFHAQPDGNSLKGTTEVKLSRQGRGVFSHSRGEGMLRGYQALSESQAVLVNLGGDNGYFQLYAPKQLGYLIGNYYGKTGAKGTGAHKKSGTVTLQAR